MLIRFSSPKIKAALGKTASSQGLSDLGAFLCIQGVVLIKETGEGILHLLPFSYLAIWKNALGSIFSSAIGCIPSWGTLGSRKMTAQDPCSGFEIRRQKGRAFTFALLRNLCNMQLLSEDISTSVYSVSPTSFHHNLYIMSVCFIGFKVFIDNVFWCIPSTPCLWL